MRKLRRKLQRFSFALSLSALSSGVAAAAGLSPTVFPNNPTFHYHANSGVTTAGSPSRVTAVTDIRGFANATEGLDASSLGGPLAETDLLGRPYWNFEGNSYLNVQNTFGANQRAVGFIAVVRMAKVGLGYTIVSLGNVTNLTPASTGASALGTNSSSTGPWIRGSSISASSGGAGKEKIVAGSQLQVIAVSSTAAGQRLFVNNNWVDVGATSINAVGLIGAEIARYSNSPGAVTDPSTYNTGTWMQGHMYEVAGFVAPTHAQMVANVAAVVANFAIPDIVNQIVFEGDSITMGSTSPPNWSPSMLMTNPGASLKVPDTCRVINMGTSGDRVSNLVSRRDTALNIEGNALLSGAKNIIMLEIGRNDWPVIGGTATYSALVPLIHTTTTGYIERGWEVMALINQASSSNQTNCDQQRALMRDITQFRTDCAATAAQLNIGEVALIEYAGSTRFSTAADSLDTTYYQSGNTHLKPLGYEVKSSGGTTPAYGHIGLANARLSA